MGVHATRAVAAAAVLMAALSVVAYVGQETVGTELWKALFALSLPSVPLLILLWLELRRRQRRADRLRRRVRAQAASVVLRLDELEVSVLSVPAERRSPELTRSWDQLRSRALELLREEEALMEDLRRPRRGMQARVDEHGVLAADLEAQADSLHSAALIQAAHAGAAEAMDRLAEDAVEPSRQALAALDEATADGAALGGLGAPLEEAVADLYAVLERHREDPDAEWTDRWAAAEARIGEAGAALVAALRERCAEAGEEPPEEDETVPPVRDVMTVRLRDGLGLERSLPEGAGPVLAHAAELADRLGGRPVEPRRGAAWAAWDRAASRHGIHDEFPGERHRMLLGELEDTGEAVPPPPVEEPTPATDGLLRHVRVFGLTLDQAAALWKALQLFPPSLTALVAGLLLWFGPMMYLRSAGDGLRSVLAFWVLLAGLTALLLLGVGRVLQGALAVPSAQMRRRSTGRGLAEVGRRLEALMVDEDDRALTGVLLASGPAGSVEEARHRLDEAALRRAWAELELLRGLDRRALGDVGAEVAVRALAEDVDRLEEREQDAREREGRLR